jgi:hypothetical protein
LESPEPDICPFCPDTVDRSKLKTTIRDLFVFDNLYPLDAGGGYHRVLTLSDQHLWRWHNSDDLQATRAALAWQECMDIGPEVPFISSWCSVGLFAGATQPHAHAQFLAFDQIPPGILNEGTGASLGEGFELASREDWHLLLPASTTAPGEVRLLSSKPHGKATEHWGPLAAQVVKAFQVTYGPSGYNLVTHLSSPAPHIHAIPRRGVPSAVEILEGWHPATRPSPSDFRKALEEVL